MTLFTYHARISVGSIGTGGKFWSPRSGDLVAVVDIVGLGSLKHFANLLLPVVDVEGAPVSVDDIAELLAQGLVKVLRGLKRSIVTIVTII